MRSSRLLSGKMKYELSTLISLFIAVSYAVVAELKVCTAQPIEKLQAVDSDPISGACGSDLALGGMQSNKGVYWGFLPDCCTGGTPTSMSHINGLTGKKAST